MRPPRLDVGRGRYRKIAEMDPRNIPTIGGRRTSDGPLAKSENSFDNELRELCNVPTRPNPFWYSERGGMVTREFREKLRVGERSYLQAKEKRALLFFEPCARI